MSEDRIGPWPNPVRSPHFQVIYSNASRTVFTPWDISVLLAQTSISSLDSVTSIMELIQITFSPQHFKALASAFSSAVSAYEAQFGSINVNADLLQSPEAFSEALQRAAAASRQSTDQRNP